MLNPDIQRHVLLGALLIFRATFAVAQSERPPRDLEKSEVDALVADLRTLDPVKQLSALRKGDGVLRRDFRDAVANLLDAPNDAVSEAARALIVKCHVEAGYALAVRRAAAHWRSDEMQCSPEGDTDLFYPRADVPLYVLRTPVAVKVLTDFFPNATGPEHRLALLTWLGQSRQPSAVAFLASLVNDLDADVDIRAARALGAIGTPDALDVLVEVGESTNPRLARQAAALGASYDDRALPIWKRLLRDHPNESREADLWVANARQAESLIPLLLPLLSHHDESVRFESNISLERITGARVRFISEVDDDSRAPHGEINPNARRWKEWMETQGKRPRYERILDDVRIERTRSNGNSLHRLLDEGDPRAIPALVPMIGRFEKVGLNEMHTPMFEICMLSGQYFETADDVSGWLQKNGVPAESPLVSAYHPLRLIGQTIIDPCAEHLANNRRTLFVGTRSSLQVFDIKDPPNPEIIGRRRVGAEHLEADDERVAVQVDEKEQVLFKHTPAGDLTFESSGDAPVPFRARGRIVPGQMIAGRQYTIEEGLLLIRDKATQEVLGKAMARSPYDRELLVRDGRAYLLLDDRLACDARSSRRAAKGEYSLLVYDVVDAANIKVLSHMPMPPGIWRGLTVSGNTLYACNYDGDLLAYELPWK